CAGVARDVQLGPARRLAGRALRGLAHRFGRFELLAALGFLALAILGEPPGFFFRLRQRRLGRTPTGFFFLLFAAAPLGFLRLRLEALLALTFGELLLLRHLDDRLRRRRRRRHSRRLLLFVRRLLRRALAILLLVLHARLLFEDAAVQVGLLATHLHVDGARAALGRCNLDLALRLALESDFAGRGRFTAPVRAAQECQQLHLGVVADGVLGAGHVDARLIELREQALDRHLQHLGKLANRHIRHVASSAVYAGAANASARCDR